MAKILDPWDDAALIASRLISPDCRLIVVIGAEQWCEKCRQFKPEFEAYAAHRHNGDVMLWLDLEDHQEFIGPYIPEDLPELQVYRQGQLVMRHPISGAAAKGLDALLINPETQMPPSSSPPQIAQRLMQADWAK